MVKLTAILKAVNTLLKNKFGYHIYGDEIQEDLVLPAFFVSMHNQTENQTINFNNNKLSIYITYMPEIYTQIDQMNIIDGLKNLFDLGFYVEARYLHINDFEVALIGDDKNILQGTISVTYLNETSGNHYVDETQYSNIENMKINVNDEKREIFNKN